MTEPMKGLLDGDEYFDCRLLCRMPKATCITRQTIGIKYHGHAGHVPLECQDCALGQTIKNNAGPILQIEPAIKNEENTMEQTTQTEPKKIKRGSQRVAPCDNCGRVLPRQGKGLCGGCRAITKTTPPEQLEAALAAAKVRFNAPDFNGRAHSYRGRRSKLPGIPAAAGAPVIASEARQSQDKPEVVISVHSPNINLVFPSHDKSLYDAILAEARRNRRDPDQQIMWIVQEALAL